jgi:hypothetical protein
MRSLKAARPAAEGSELSIPPRSSALEAVRHADPRRQRHEAGEFRLKTEARYLA